MVLALVKSGRQGFTYRPQPIGRHCAVTEDRSPKGRLIQQFPQDAQCESDPFREPGDCSPQTNRMDEIKRETDGEVFASGLLPSRARFTHSRLERYDVLVAGAP
jgi:hypothetical protein